MACCTTAAVLSVINWIQTCCSRLLVVDSLLCVLLILLAIASLIASIISGDSCAWFVVVQVSSVHLHLDIGGMTVL